MYNDIWSHPFFKRFAEPQPGKEVSFTRICPKFERINSPWTFLEDSCSMCVYMERRKQEDKVFSEEYCCYPHKQNEDKHKDI